MSFLEGLLGRDRQPDLYLTDEDLSALAGARSAEDVAVVGLEWLVRVTQPLAAFAYLLSTEDRQYRLTSSYVPSEQAQPQPDYAGLMAQGRTERHAALTLDISASPPVPTVTDRAGERWLAIPCGPQLLLQARLPRHAKVTAELQKAAATMGRVIAPQVALAVRLDLANADRERLKASLAASRAVGEAVLRPERSLDLLFRLPLGVLGANSGGLILAVSELTGPTVPVAQGGGADLCQRILDGGVPELIQLPVGPDLVTGPAIGRLRDYGVTAVARVPAIHGGQAVGCAFYFFPDVPDFTSYQQAVLATIGDRLAQIIGSTRLMNETAGQYLRTLRSLVTALDSISPHTIGHSDRMARYARMIARELELGKDDLEAVALGAYLHDVGMIAIDLKLTTKEGRLTQDEYETLREHPRVGAELVVPVQSPVPIAPMVEHHHERWDSRGYPYRLGGREIPLGARIIAVCDMFEAKTTGRSYRKPIPFAKALEDLRSAAGTQLDGEIVEAFVRAWKGIRRNATAGRPLTRCWEFKQAPADICGACPNRTLPAQFACWDSPGNLCTRHGDTCPTCPVYTESLSRSSGGVLSG